MSSPFKIVYNFVIIRRRNFITYLSPTALLTCNIAKTQEAVDFVIDKSIFFGFPLILVQNELSCNCV